MELNLHSERAFCVFVRYEWIYSACGSRSTHGLAPQSADTEPVHCFNATDSWSTPLSSSFIIPQKDVSASSWTLEAQNFHFNNSVCNNSIKRFLYFSSFYEPAFIYRYILFES